jgi:hypothetical protein
VIDVEQDDGVVIVRTDERGAQLRMRLELIDARDLYLILGGMIADLADDWLAKLAVDSLRSAELADGALGRIIGVYETRAEHARHAVTDALARCGDRGLEITRERLTMMALVEGWALDIDDEIDRRIGEIVTYRRRAA